MLEGWPETLLVDEVAGNEFRAVIPRPATGTPEVKRMRGVLQGEMNQEQIMARLGLKDERHFCVRYQQAAIAAGLIEMPLPNKPRSRLQQYRLTALGRRRLATHPDV